MSSLTSLEIPEFNSSQQTCVGFSPYPHPLSKSLLHKKKSVGDYDFFFTMIQLMTFKIRWKLILFLDESLKYVQLVQQKAFYIALS